jgi:hypothetical protein
MHELLKEDIISGWPGTARAPAKQSGLSGLPLFPFVERL